MSGQGLIAIRKTRSAIMDVVSNSAFYKCRPTARAATPRQRENIKDFNRRRRRRENIMANVTEEHACRQAVGDYITLHGLQSRPRSSGGSMGEGRSTPVRGPEKIFSNASEN